MVCAVVAGSKADRPGSAVRGTCVFKFPPDTVYPLKGQFRLSPEGTVPANGHPELLTVTVIMSATA